MNVGPYKILGQIRQRVDCLSVCIIAYLFSFETNSLRMPTGGNACARKGRSETWQFAKNKFWIDFVRKQTFRESRQVLLRKRMSRGFEFVLILQTTRGSNFGLLATEVYLTSFIILVFSTCVRSIRESLGETTPAGLESIGALLGNDTLRDYRGLNGFSSFCSPINYARRVNF
ncbi:hypothetical protein AVEN_115450-1 [Araneus ventricosus]|uniref:Uncharacterized protein n=1 Tax=Araneus ventricosus TaxID=182803 RepID=A0A4Y2Q1W2_ARAVE|nr:hypothetical protein AVEN_236070-1 [Araneus ventricosus]GBN57133.1 hypothetical protein AVEN_115450-1 [Araneus ventricosus]